MALFIETGKLTFTGTDTGTITFSTSFKTIPKITAMATDDVNVYIENISTSGATVRTSGIFSGEIHYQIMNNE